MPALSEPSDGALVISTWIDSETDEFRARIAHSTDSIGPALEVRYLASPDDVLAFVVEWLGKY